jgi:deoxyhypusine synthase
MLPSEHPGCDALLRAMGNMSFQARSLSRAADVFTRMNQTEGVLKILTLAGALIPGGCKRVIMEMISQRLIDVIVSTGANVSHDLVEGLGYHHWQHCNFESSDVDLRNAFVNRVYDTYLDDDDFNRTALAVIPQLGRLAGRRTSREICEYLGRLTKTPCMLSAAAQAGVPIYVPALNDSELAITLHRYNDKVAADKHIIWDGLGDNLSFADLIKGVEDTGILICGGGVPRNWAQQVTPLLEYLNWSPGETVRHFEGYRYGIQITTDTPVYGGMSGCTFSESISWGKYKVDSEHVTVHCDVTIALPLIVAATLARRRPGVHHRSGVAD